MQKKKLGLVGYGNFGQFIAKYLREYFIVSVHSPHYEYSVSLEEIAKCDYIVLSVTLDRFENVCKELSGMVGESTVIVDVCSVKVLPIKIMQRYFPHNPILGTHPIFGPQSGKDGVGGLPIVLANVSLKSDQYTKIKNFLSDKIKLEIIEMSADDHDREMSYVQGLSHLIGRALSMMDIKEYKTATKSYKQLISLEHLVGDDSLELYKTIQMYNPYTNEVREQFLNTLHELEYIIKKEPEGSIF